jgi:hypothetical protein
LGDKVYCQPCANEIFVKGPSEAKAVPSARSGKLTAGGITGIVAGAISFIVGIVLAAVGATMPIFGEVAGALVVMAVIGIILGIVGIVGCIYALRRKSFGFSLAGGICAFLSAIFSLSVGYVVPIMLGIAAIVLIAMSKSEFA